MSRSPQSLQSIKSGFIAHGWPEELVDEVLAAFEEAKSRFYRSDFRPQAVEGGRFSEGVIRLMQFSASGKYDPLSLRTFNVGRVITWLENQVGASDSVRFHVPRAVRLIYDIRNNRDAGHLRDGIDPNFQDATLVVICMDWILAELVRIAHDVSPGDAHAMIVDIVKKEVPAIQVFDGKPVLLKDLKAADVVLVLLYWAGSDGVPLDELRSWLPDNVRKNLGRTLKNLQMKHLVYNSGRNHSRLTDLGLRDVEDRRLLGAAER